MDKKLKELAPYFAARVEAIIGDVAGKGVALEIEPVYGGLRSPEQQRKIVGAGHSKTLKSYHLTGEAADLYQRAEGKLSWPSKRAQFLIGSSALVHGVGWGGNFFRFDPLKIKRRRLKAAILGLRALGWPLSHEMYDTPVGWDACHVQVKNNFV